MFQNLIHFFVTEGDGEYLLRPAGYAALVILLLLIIFIITLLGKSEKRMNTKQLVFASMALALATITSFIKLASLPFGGSITLFSMFFICFIGYLYGPKIGLTTGIAYGILQLIVDPYIYHPWQLILDYPLAFGALGLSGLFYKSNYGLVKGCIVGILGRYLFHVISGYIFFGSYAPENMNSLIYTLGYNATYIIPELIATVIILCLPPVTLALKEVKRTA
ncbi:thiamine transporter [Mobilisporobacter senegalensis]|uniref:Thiamine transporter n=1 Tax=Mobilisporobacter senegalensis TaxID=1329262 RepID=A0A3N1XNI6_9FIRM|nr:energy-coupled thiamine transporter ThiT [Mobilisporobacter senegalensis]ROR28244.1 thiamine transporter [Mobilisporobacter senegalensis]